MTVAAIQPLDLVAPQLAARPAVADAVAAARPPSFAEMLMQGVETTSTKIAEADQLVARAVLDDSIPLHQVTYALEAARLSFELMIQLRNRLLDASQQLMNLQL